MKPFGVVYLIWNMVNGRRYVGQTVQPLEKRFNKHVSCKSMLISKAIRKYGRENFHYGVIKSCASKEELDYWEKYFIVALHSKTPYGYDCTDGGEGTIGWERPPEYRAKLLAMHLGVRNHRYGKKISPEHTARIVAANTGAKRTSETCKNISEALKGKKHTKERCSHVSIAQRGDSPYKNLIAELDAYKLSYAALAKLLGVAPSIVSRKMHGIKNFTAGDAAKLEEIFGKGADYLLERTEL